MGFHLIKLPPLITGPWTIADLRAGTIGSPRHGLKVFSCFHCGGGSSFGYKLAGFDVLGGVEIDPEMMAIYRANHFPKHSYLMGVQEFKNIPDAELPADLFNLDVLDGSPPCSSFSMAGSREKAWGKEKMFREGQAHQVLDDLFFHFIEVAVKLRPKVLVAENVKGLIMGAAKGYVKEIFAGLNKAGYDCQLFLLNASRMGVPQARERTFFIARRRDLNLTKLVLTFDEPPITVAEAVRGCSDTLKKKLVPSVAKRWHLVPPGRSFADAGEGAFFSWRKLEPNAPSPTVTGTHCQVHWREPRLMTAGEVQRLQSFPDDYDFGKTYGPYVCGMSVPPLMMQRVATEIAKLLLNQIT